MIAERHLILHNGKDIYDIRCSKIDYVNFYDDYKIIFKFGKEYSIAATLKRPSNFMDELNVRRTYEDNRFLFQIISRFVFEGDGNKIRMEVDFDKPFNEILEDNDPQGEGDVNIS